MKLLRKTLLIIGVTIIVLIGVLVVASQIIMSSGVAQQENRIAEQNVDRLLDAFYHEVSDLDKTAFDWAFWDDTYAFVQNVSSEYVSSNLVDVTFRNLRLNFMLFIDGSGQMVYGKAFDLLNETEIPIPQSLVEHLGTHEQLLDHESTESSIYGFIRLPETVVILASRPILTSEQQGPIRGTLIIGRFFDSMELDYILERVHLPVTVQILGDATVSSDFLSANASLSMEEPVFIKPLSDKIISGYALIEDVYGNPVLIFRVDTIRDLYAQGLVSAFYINALLVFVGLTYAILTVWLLEKFVLSRLSKLTMGVKRIGENGDFNARLSTTGNDELTGLTDQINEMLSTLGKTKESLSVSETRLRQITESMFDMVSLTNAEGVYQYVSPSVKRTLGYEPQELLDKSIFDFLHPDDASRVAEAVQKAVETKTSGNMEYRYRHKDGHFLWLEGAGNLLRDDKGQVVGAVISSHDITERKHMEEQIKESEGRLQRLIEYAPEAIYISDLNGVFLDGNKQAEKIIGYKKEELIGKSFLELGILPEKYLPKVAEMLQQNINGEKAGAEELELVRKDGSTVYIEVSAFPIQRAGKVEVVGIARDITERKNAEKAILESQQKFERLFKGNPDASVYVDANDRFLDANPRFVELFGYSIEEAKGKALDNLIVPEDKKKEAVELTQESMKGYIYHETKRKRKNGSIIPVSISAAPIYVNNQFEGCIISYRDITERKRMEMKLQHTTKRLETLLKTAREGIVAVDPQENITFANKAFAEMLGYEETELLGLNSKTFLDEEGRRKIAEETELRKKGMTDRYELTMYSKNGEPRATQLSAAPLWNEDGSYAGSLGIVMDITERKKMEEALRESEEKIRNILQSSPDAILVSDLNGNVIECNQATLSMFGVAERAEVIGKNAIEFVAEKDRQKLPEDMVKGIEQGVNKNLEYALRDVNGREFPAEVSTSVVRDAMGNPLYFVVILEDVTERMQMQQKLEEYSQQLEALVEKRTKQLQEANEQLIKSERLAAIGQVAAMVGHDLRNPLTGIKGATYYLKTKPMMKKDKKSKEMLELIEKDIEYSNKIITDLLEYSREIHLELTETTPQLIIEETLPLLETPNNIQIVNLTEKEPKIMVDIEKLNRVFVNIIKNAFDAMPNGGKLTITSTKTNGNTEFSFTDTGIGIPKEHIAKLWTPFFTTKAKGMGLGLPICKRIVEAHRGHITVESTVGSGTTFTITIPIELKTKEERGEKIWINAQESLLSTTTKASEKS